MKKVLIAAAAAGGVRAELGLRRGGGHGAARARAARGATRPLVKMPGELARRTQGCCMIYFNVHNKE
jgi:hypothetical protein